MTQETTHLSNYDLTQSIIDQDAHHNVLGVSERAVRETLLGTSIACIALFSSYIGVESPRDGGLFFSIEALPLCLHLIDLTRKRFTNKRYGLSFGDKERAETRQWHYEKNCIGFFKLAKQNGYSVMNRDTAILIFNVASGFGLGGIGPSYVDFLVNNPYFLLLSAGALLLTNIGFAYKNSIDADTARNQPPAYSPV